MKKPIPGHIRKAEFYTEEKCYISELLNTPEDPDVSVAKARVEPGVTTRWHCLRDVTERYCIVSGKGSVEVDTHPPRDVQAGDVVFIPPMCRQRITNNGEEDLIFLAVCTPRFTEESYIDVDGINTGETKE